MTVKTETSSDSPLATTLTRRGFVKIGGALFVSFALPAGFRAQTAESRASLQTNQLNPTLLASWLEIRSDNTILIRTGRTETGTGMSGYYTQVIAEELSVRPDAGRWILCRFPERNDQRSQGRRVHLSSAA
jgi:nicotinate dehydrogenase subunit B